MSDLEYSWQKYPAEGLLTTEKALFDRATSF